MRLLELNARTYVGKDYNEFLRSREEEDQEGNEWKQLLGPQKVPTQYPCRVLVDPNRITMAMESYSIEEMTAHPEDPSVDTVLLCLEDGTTLSLIGDMDDFMTRLDEFNELDQNE